MAIFRLVPFLLGLMLLAACSGADERVAIQSNPAENTDLEGIFQSFAVTTGPSNRFPVERGSSLLLQFSEDTIRFSAGCRISEVSYVLSESSTLETDTPMSDGANCSSALDQQEELFDAFLSQNLSIDFGDDQITLSSNAERAIAVFERTDEFDNLALHVQTISDSVVDPILTEQLEGSYRPIAVTPGSGGGAAPEDLSLLSVSFIDGRVFFRIDCNSANGPYSVSLGQTLQVGEAEATAEGCSEPLPVGHSFLSRVLNRAPKVELNDDALTLRLSTEDGATIEYVRSLS